VTFKLHHSNHSETAPYQLGTHPHVVRKIQELSLAKAPFDFVMFEVHKYAAALLKDLGLAPATTLEQIARNPRFYPTEATVRRIRRNAAASAQMRRLNHVALAMIVEQLEREGKDKVFLQLEDQSLQRQFLFILQVCSVVSCCSCCCTSCCSRQLLVTFYHP